MAIYRQGDRYRVDSYAGPTTILGSAWEAAYAVAQALIARAASESPRCLDLHGAAVQLAGGGAVLLLGPRGVGKSTIMVHLAAAGHRLLGDDRLLLSLPGPRNGAGGARVVALGLAAMVRSRFHRGSGLAIRSFIDGRIGACNGDRLLLRLDEGQQASFGEARPLTGLVVLERRGPAAARLSPASRADAVRALFIHGATALPNRALLPLLAAATAPLSIHRLGFTDAAQAAQAVATAHTPTHGAAP